MKLAISGKGGVGKSTLAAALALLLARKKHRVLAVDADPDANLASALGIPPAQQEQIIPLSKQVDLIEERTGAKVNQYGQVFKLNPDVSDISEKYTYNHRGVALLVLGAVQQGGGGCACPESVLLRALVTDLILYKNDALVMDMEAGVEHLGRATVRGVDHMIIVVEPGRRSIDSARRIMEMGRGIGLRRFRIVANKVTGPDDETFIRNSLNDLLTTDQDDQNNQDNQDIIGVIPYSEEIRRLDRAGCSITDSADSSLTAPFETILEYLLGVNK